MNFTGIYKLVLAMLMLGFTNVALAEAYSGVMTQERQSAMTPQDVLERLKDGNTRFLNGVMKNRDLLTQAAATSAGQFPVAVVLNCMDSRTPPEIVFDQGVGDVFVTRIAGNILNDDILGSMEFGAQIAGARLIAVIGHTNCGAVRGACSKATLGHLTGLLNKIQPAVAQATKEAGPKDCAKNEFIDQVAKDNVLMVIKQIKARSPVISRLIGQGKLGIVGGIQDIATGQVTFFDEANVMPAQQQPAALTAPVPNSNTPN